jgi:hypothetical protein
MIGNRILNVLGQGLVKYLTSPIPDFTPSAVSRFDLLASTLRPADVLLVEGNTRISTAIKYLTQSTWSHSALYIGPVTGQQEPSGEPHVLLEAEVAEGVVTAPLSKYRNAHVRICRPVSLGGDGQRQVIDFAVARIGHDYDVKNVIDLMRYLLPTPPVPTRFRRRMIALGAGKPTRSICSTLIAQAFQSVRYPILPRIENFGDAGDAVRSEAARREILHIRHHSLFAPRDFDISPYFAIVKPTIEHGFNYRDLNWANETVTPSPET